MCVNNIDSLQLIRYSFIYGLRHLKVPAAARSFTPTANGSI